MTVDKKEFRISLQCKCGEWVALDLVPVSATDILELAPSASPNSDYAAAMRALDAFVKYSTYEVTLQMFRRFCEDRLNSAKAPNCA